MRTEAIVQSAILSCALAGAAFAGPVPQGFAVRGGACINELIADPTGAGIDFDTDRNGTATREDEFVEIFNLGDEPVDLAGLEIWDSANANSLMFEFPPGATLAPGAFAVVLVRVGAGGSLPAVASPNLAFDAALETTGFGRIADGGENIALVDPLTGEYVQILYGGVEIVHFPTFGPPGFPGTTLLGTVENLGSDVDGSSVGRDPDGSTTAGSYWTISEGAVRATPGAPSPSNLRPNSAFLLY